MAEITSKEQEKKTLLYRRVFGSREGKEVLTDMRLDLDFFSTMPADDHEATTRKNYAAFLLYNLGITIDKNIPAIVDKMLSIEYTIIEDDNISSM